MESRELLEVIETPEFVSGNERASQMAVASTVGAGRNTSQARKAVAWLNSLGCPHALLVNSLSELADVLILAEVLFSLLGDDARQYDGYERDDPHLFRGINGQAGFASPPGAHMRARARLLEIVARHSDYRPRCGIAQAALGLGLRDNEMLLLELVAALQTLRRLPREEHSADVYAQERAGADSSSHHAFSVDIADGRRIRNVNDVDEGGTGSALPWDSKNSPFCTSRYPQGHQEEAGRVRRLTLHYEQSIKEESSSYVSSAEGKEKKKKKMYREEANRDEEEEDRDDGDKYRKTPSPSLGPPSASSVRALSMLAEGGFLGSESSDSDITSQRRHRRASIGGSEGQGKSRRSSVLIPGTGARRKSVPSVASLVLSPTSTPPRNDTTSSSSSSCLSEVQERIVVWLLELGIPIPGARIHKQTSCISMLPSTSRVVQAMRNGVFIGTLVNIVESPPGAVRQITVKGQTQMRVNPPLVRVIESPKSTAECRSNIKNALAFLQESTSFSRRRQGAEENLFDDCVRDVVDGKEDRIWALLTDFYETYGNRNDRPMRLSVSDHARNGSARTLGQVYSSGRVAHGDSTPLRRASNGEDDEWVKRMNTAKRAAWKRRSSVRLSRSESTSATVPPVDCLNLYS